LSAGSIDIFTAATAQVGINTLFGKIGRECFYLIFTGVNIAGKSNGVIFNNINLAGQVFAELC
jgi:hypothetical protein